MHTIVQFCLYMNIYFPKFIDISVFGIGNPLEICSAIQSQEMYFAVK